MDSSSTISFGSFPSYLFPQLSQWLSSCHFIQRTSWSSISRFLYSNPSYSQLLKESPTPFARADSGFPLPTFYLWAPSTQSPFTNSSLTLNSPTSSVIVLQSNWSASLPHKSYSHSCSFAHGPPYLKCPTLSTSFHQLFFKIQPKWYYFSKPLWPTLGNNRCSRSPLDIQLLPNVPPL